MVLSVRSGSARLLTLLAAASLLLVFAQVLPAHAAGAVSVTSFGAVANDGVDDTAAFQRAIDAAAGGVLNIPAGRYEISHLNVTHPMEIAGVGDASLLHQRDGSNASVITIRNTHDVYVHDLQIDGNLTGQTGGYPHGIQFDNSVHGFVTRVLVHDCEKSGVVFYNGSDEGTTTDSRFYNNENDVEIHSSAYCYVSGNRAERTEFESYVTYEQAYGPGMAHHNTIVNNYSKDAYAGVNVQRTHDNLIKGNRIENSKWGIMIEAQNGSTYSYSNVIQGNVLVGGANSTAYALNVEAPSKGDVLTGNTVTGWHNTPLRITAPNTTFTNNTLSGNDKSPDLSASCAVVTGNTFSRSGQTGFLITAPLNGLVFANNTVEGSAREGVLVLDTLTNASFLRNTIRGNGTAAPRTLDGLHAIKPWTASALIGNRIGDDTTATQLRAVWLIDGSTIAVAANDLAGNVNGSRFAAATSGATVAVAAGYADGGTWRCTASGRPGTWSKATTVRVLRTARPNLRVRSLSRRIPNAHPVTSRIRR